jgi:hypothetical protein
MVPSNHTAANRTVLVRNVRERALERPNGVNYAPKSDTESTKPAHRVCNAVTNRPFCAYFRFPVVSATESCREMI